MNSVIECEGCAKPAGGVYIASCRACSLRKIARSLEYWKSRAMGKLTPEYLALLAELGDPVRVHLEEIKPMVARGET